MNQQSHENSHHPQVEGVSASTSPTPSGAPAKPPRNPPRNCNHCKQALDENGKTINSNGDLFHARCFIFISSNCWQDKHLSGASSAPSAFDPSRRGSSLSLRGASIASTTSRFLDFEKQEQNLLQVLFAPCCAKCSEFIIGRVLKVSLFLSLSFKLSKLQQGGNLYIWEITS